jgi:hypothetical protein
VYVHEIEFQAIYVGVSRIEADRDLFADRQFSIRKVASILLSGEILRPCSRVPVAIQIFETVNEKGTEIVSAIRYSTLYTLNVNLSDPAVGNRPVARSSVDPPGTPQSNREDQQGHKLKDSQGTPPRWG